MPGAKATLLLFRPVKTHLPRKQVVAGHVDHKEPFALIKSMQPIEGSEQKNDFM